MNKPNTILFDLYDTLVFIAQNTHAYSELFSELSLDKKTSRKAKHIALTKNFVALKDYVKRISSNTYNNIDIAKYEDLLKVEVNSVELYSQTINVLDKLKKQGYKLGLVSNLATQFKEPFYDLGLESFFDTVVFSCDREVKKPNPEIYLTALRYLKSSPRQAMMVGDNLHNDVIIPSRLGINTIHVDRSSVEIAEKSITSLEGIFKYL